jgi:hypothetical protein
MVLTNFEVGSLQVVQGDVDDLGMHLGCLMGWRLHREKTKERRSVKVCC